MATTPTPKIGMILRELASRKIRSSSTGGNLIRTWSASATTTTSGNAGGVTKRPETQTEQRVDRLMLKKDRLYESYTRPIRIYVT